MKKIYYDENGWVCERYPYDIPIADTRRYIEVDEEKYNQTLSTTIYFAWRVVNGQLVNEEYTELTSEQKEEKHRLMVECEIAEHKQFLADTDYVITKLTEAQAIGDEAELSELHTQYNDVLDERKRRRALINDLEKSL